MDNCVKDNKNRYLLAFLLLLMAKEVFQEVRLGFLVVGCTHEDIDGCFGYLYIERTKQLYFGKFDEGFDGFIKETFQSTFDSRNSKF
jgi:hypothetical protein